MTPKTEVLLERIATALEALVEQGAAMAEMDVAEAPDLTKSVDAAFDAKPAPCHHEWNRDPAHHEARCYKCGGIRRA